MADRRGGNGAQRDSDGRPVGVFGPWAPGYRVCDVHNYGHAPTMMCLRCRLEGVQRA